MSQHGGGCATERTELATDAQRLRADAPRPEIVCEFSTRTPGQLPTGPSKFLWLFGYWRQKVISQLAAAHTLVCPSTTIRIRAPPWSPTLFYPTHGLLVMVSLVPVTHSGDTFSHLLCPLEIRALP